MKKLFDTLISLGLGENEAKTYIALIDFIILNSARNDLDGEILIKELIDLGIPKENCMSLGMAFSKNKAKLKSFLLNNSLKSKF